MDDFQKWTEQLSDAEEKMSELYEQLSELRLDLKNAGRKKDAAAFDEPMERLARYGRLFAEVRGSWGENE